MSLSIAFWKPSKDGSETLVDEFDITEESQIDDILQEFINTKTKRLVVVRITKEDRDNNTTKTLWIKPGYKSPFSEDY